MSRILLFASVAASWMLLVKGYAQAPSIREHIPTNLVNVDARTASNPGVWKEVIENHGWTPLVAFHATFHCGRHGNVFYDHDPLFFYGKNNAISPESSFEMEADDPARCPGGIDAAIFADGHTEGSAIEIDAIFQRRRGTYEAIGLALPLLDDIAANKKTVHQVQKAFSDLDASVRNDPTLGGPERGAMLLLFLNLSRTLDTTGGVLRTATDRTGQGRPTYTEIAAKQSVTLEQAQAIGLAKKLLEWRSDLEGFLSPAPPR